MKQVAIWKDHTVIGYCMMDDEMRDILNSMPNAGVYYGTDEKTRASTTVAAISFEVNNGGTLAVTQGKHDGAVRVETRFPDGDGRTFAISAGDFVMLMNYYQYQKEQGEPIL
jgi:hypothetical protein